MNINEKQIGDVSLDTFRPSESEKAVLINLDTIDASRRGVVEQDIINIPDTVKKEKQLTTTTLDGAFDNLLRLGILQRNNTNLIVMSDAGQEIVDRVKQQSPDSNPTDPSTTIESVAPSSNKLELIKELNETAAILQFLETQSKR